MLPLRFLRCQSENVKAVITSKVSHFRHLGTSKGKTSPSDTHKAREITIPVPFGHIAGKWWGPQDNRPMLALHGWQDNAGSFDTLIPLLPPNTSILAIDLPGHGLSSPYPDGVFYHYHDLVVIIRRMVKYFDWKSISFLAHSLGNFAAYIYAGSFPKEVDRFITFDMLRPYSMPSSTLIDVTVISMEQFIAIETKLKSDSAPSYTHQELVDLVVKGTFGALTRESTEVLLKRGAVKVNQQNGEMRYRLARDLRLKCESLVRPSHDLNIEYARRIKCPVLFVKAKEGVKYEPYKYLEETMDTLRQSTKMFEYHEVEGTHYLHINNPERVAPIINKFLSST